jgi:hypothetical protein
LLWRFNYERPVDLCAALGRLIWERHRLMYGESLTYDAVLADQQALLDPLFDELCTTLWLRPLIHDVFRLEAAGSMLSEPLRNSASLPVLSADEGDFPRGEEWRSVRPRYAREMVREVSLGHRLDRLLYEWDKNGEMPPKEGWLQIQQEPRTALVYLGGPALSRYKIVDRDLTYRLLLRLCGYFPVSACLDTMLRNWRESDLTPLWTQLSNLARIGIIRDLRPQVDARGQHDTALDKFAYDNMADTVSAAQ